MHPMLNIAVRAARTAGDLIIKKFEFFSSLNENFDRNKFIMSLDFKAEKLITKIIHQAYPKHIIFSKRNKISQDKKNFHWIIDPLSGMTNYIKSLPHFAVSIAFCIKEKTEVAVVYDAVKNELFSAVRGQNSQLNGYRLRRSSTRKLHSSILAIGYFFKEKKYNNVLLKIVNKILSECADFRRSGSSSLDLSYVAAGRMDGYLDTGLKVWDYTAGALLVQESGGLVMNFFGKYNNLFSGDIIAGNPYVAKKILENMHDIISNC